MAKRQPNRRSAKLAQLAASLINGSSAVESVGSQASVPRDREWHICTDCIDPIVRGLRSIGNQWKVLLDWRGLDSINEELFQLYSKYNNWNPMEDFECKSWSENDRHRQGELYAMLGVFREPAEASHLAELYRWNSLTYGITKLKVFVSVDFANDVRETLMRPLNLATQLEAEAQGRFSSRDEDVVYHSGLSPAYCVARAIDEETIEFEPNVFQHPHDGLFQQYRAMATAIEDARQYAREVSDVLRSWFDNERTTVDEVHSTNQPPTLENEDWWILEALAAKATVPATPMVQAEISAAIENGGHTTRSLSRSAVGSRLPKLRILEFVASAGERKGEIITDKGLTAVKQRNKMHGSMHGESPPN